MKPHITKFDCDKASNVTIMHIAVTREPDGILKDKVTVFGLGNDQKVYLWNYEENCWKHYCVTCEIEVKP